MNLFNGLRMRLLNMYDIGHPGSINGQYRAGNVLFKTLVLEKLKILAYGLCFWLTLFIRSNDTNHRTTHRMASENIIGIAEPIVKTV